MEDDIKQILRENTTAIVNLEKTQCRLISLVEGDPKAGVKGYGHRLQELEKYKNVDRKIKWLEGTVVVGILSYLGLK